MWLLVIEKKVLFQGEIHTTEQNHISTRLKYFSLGLLHQKELILK